MYGRWLCTLSSFFPTTCPNNVVCLTLGCFPGMLPWRFSIHCKMNKETISNSRTKYDFYFFFPFLHAQKQAAGVVLQCRTGVSACHCRFSAFNLAFKSQSISAMNRLQPHACTFRLFAWTCLRSRNDLRHLEICSYLQVPQRDRLTVALFFFFFFTVDRTTNRVQPPPSHMKDLSFVRDV